MVNVMPSTGRKLRSQAYCPRERREALCTLLRPSSVCSLALVSLVAGAPKVLLKGDVSAGPQSHMGSSARVVRFIGLAEVAATVPV